MSARTSGSHREGGLQGRPSAAEVVHRETVMRQSQWVGAGRCLEASGRSSATAICRTPIRTRSKSGPGPGPGAGPGPGPGPSPSLSAGPGPDTGLREVAERLVAANSGRWSPWRLPWEGSVSSPAVFTRSIHSVGKRLLPLRQPLPKML